MLDKYLDTSKTILNIGYMHLDEKSLIQIFDELKSNTQVKTIHFVGNKITEEVLKSLLSCLKQNKNIEKIFLNCINAGFDEKVLSEIISALENSTSIKILNLASNTITTKVADSLAKFFKVNRSIKSVHFGFCGLDKLSEEEFKELFEAIGNNDSISFLDIHGNDLADKGDILIKTVDKNKSIFDMDVLGCNIETDYDDKILALLERNQKEYMFKYSFFAKLISRKNNQETANVEKKLEDLPAELLKIVLDYSLGKKHNEQHLKKLVDKESHRSKVSANLSNINQIS